jgi:hypothetical protein
MIWVYQRQRAKNPTPYPTLTPGKKKEERGGNALLSGVEAQATSRVRTTSEATAAKTTA